jgi:hypothetical protein
VSQPLPSCSAYACDVPLACVGVAWTLRLPAYATRVLCHLTFRQDKGFTVKQATLVVLIFGIGAAIGGLIGGILGQKAYNRNPRLLPLFIGACQV